MNTRRFITVSLLLALMLTLAPFTVIAKGGGGGGGEVAVGNNLSFPAIAVDGFAIAPLTSPSFTVPYNGSFPGLTEAEIAILATSGPWYPQQTAGNQWQAGFAIQAAENVTYIDWGDNIESINPKIRRPFRLEITLYKQLDIPMTAYKMAVLEYPSSLDELQGTNTETYASNFATVVSAAPKLILQYLGTANTAPLTWDGAKWVSADGIPTIIAGFGFAPELNVGGKYVFGASTGGWKPDKVGYYRITFFIPAGSGVNLALAQVGNFADFSANIAPTADEGGVTTPIVTPEFNLTYVDVQVVGGGGR